VTESNMSYDDVMWRGNEFRTFDAESRKARALYDRLWPWNRK